MELYSCRLGRRYSGVVEEGYQATGKLRASLHADFASYFRRGIVMKKCPNCYAFMRETGKQSQISGLPQPPSQVNPSNDVARVRYECSQCGHFEDSSPPPSRAPVYR